MAADLNPNLRPPIDLGEDVDRAMQQIQALTESDIPKVPEAIFVQHVLPVVTNHTGPVDFSTWIDVAGNAQRPIDIVDSEGKVLFRAPPLLRPYPTRAGLTGKDSFAQLLDTAKKKSEVHPLLGTNFLNQGLQARVIELGLDEESVAAWNRILVHYGYLPVGGIAPAPAGPTSASPAASGDQSIFADDEDDEL
jgi:hypothetical protein